MTIREYEKTGNISEIHFRELMECKGIENIFQISSHKERSLTARNYVGYLQTKSGFGLEILPKITMAEDDTKVRQIFLRMLQAFLNLKEFKRNKLDVTRDLPIWEMFIAMFLRELERLIKSGIQRNYQTCEENLPHWRGKLLLNQQTCHNFFQKTRFFMQYDEYTPNIPENRLIKSCLKFLLRHSRDQKNQQEIFQYLSFFNEFEESTNFAQDFHMCQKQNRLFRRYEQLISWCEVFLKQSTFSVFNEQNKNDLAISVFFPMEAVFEAYVGQCLTKYLPECNVKKQEKRHNLCREYSRANNRVDFKIQPDYIASLKEGDKKFILDAKWKGVDKTLKRERYNIAQADLYQIFAYNQIYQRENNDCDVSDKVFLIYPKSINFDEEITLKFNAEIKTTCICYPIDLSTEENTKISTKKIMSYIQTN